MWEDWIKSSKQQGTGLSWFQSRKGKTILVIVVCIGLLAILWPIGQVVPQPAAPTGAAAEPSKTGKSQQIGGQLEYILGQIEGAGTVRVDVMLASEGSREYAHNSREEKRDTSEQQAQGLNKRTVEQSTSLDLAVSSGSPLLVEERTPEVIGVLVVAGGATNIAVKEQLTSATATLLNIPLHRVMVVAGKGGQ